MCKKYYFPIVSQWTMPPLKAFSFGQYPPVLNCEFVSLMKHQMAFSPSVKLPLSVQTPS